MTDGGGMTVKEMETTLTQKGQVTIPVEIRSRLGLKPKDKVVFKMEDDVVTLRRSPSKILRWYGAVIPRARPEDFQNLREEFEKGVAEEVQGED